jgi:hypothetical protein
MTCRSRFVNIDGRIQGLGSLQAIRHATLTPHTLLTQHCIEQTRLFARLELRRERHSSRFHHARRTELLTTPRSFGFVWWCRHIGQSLLLSVEADLYVAWNSEGNLPSYRV